LEPTSLTANFCDELRKAREYQGLSIDDISRKTKIPREYLNALEQGHLEVIPASIRRGVIAAYAQTSGMNSDKVLKTLETLQGIQPIAETGTLATDRSSRERLMVGMTRAQIRTAWFASIAGNRFPPLGANNPIPAGRRLAGCPVAGRSRKRLAACQALHL
jgi:transcriptional regulator with XRE-family HTH domain